MRSTHSTRQVSTRIDPYRNTIQSKFFQIKGMFFVISNRTPHAKNRLVTSPMKMSQPRSVPGLRWVSRSLRRNRRDRGINQNRQSIKYISRNFIYSKKNKQILIKYINKSYLQIYKNTIVMSVNKPGKTVGLLHTVPG